MKILVLGSDGQIGSPLVKMLKSQKHDVIEFDIYSNKENDLRIQNVLDGIINDVDFIFFLAFDVGGSVYLDKYQKTYQFMDNNIKLMTYTFDSIKKYNKKFLFASSQMSNMDYSPYGTLKKIGEHYSNILDGTIVKFWNVYGHESDLTKSHVITDFILMAKNNQSIKMRTNGEEERQFLYSEDCCECLIELMHHHDTMDKNKDYHVTSFTWNSIIDIANIISEYYDDCEIIKSSKSDNVQLNKKNNPNKEILKYWEPKTSLRDGIRKIIEEHYVK